MIEAERILAHATDFLLSALDDMSARPPRFAVAYENARTAAELAGKAALVVGTGDYARTHATGPMLYREGLVPKDVDARRLNRLLQESTRANHGVIETRGGVPEAEAQEAVRIAEAMIALARKTIDAESDAES